MSNPVLRAAARALVNENLTSVRRALMTNTGLLAENGDMELADRLRLATAHVADVQDEILLDQIGKEGDDREAE